MDLVFDVVGLAPCSVYALTSAVAVVVVIAVAVVVFVVLAVEFGY